MVTEACAKHLYLDGRLPGFQNLRNKCLLFINYPVCGVLLYSNTKWSVAAWKEAAGKIQGSRSHTGSEQGHQWTVKLWELARDQAQPSEGCSRNDCPKLSATSDPRPRLTKAK